MFFNFFKRTPKAPPIEEYIATIREPLEVYLFGEYSGMEYNSHILKIVDGKRTHIFESTDSSMKKQESPVYIMYIKPWLEGSPHALEDLKKYSEKKKGNL